MLFPFVLGKTRCECGKNCMAIPDENGALDTLTNPGFHATCFTFSLRGMILKKNLNKSQRDASIKMRTKISLFV
jgi:hypothetical protein